MAEQRIDTRIYGAEDLTPRNDATAQAATYTAPTAVPATDAVKGSALLAEGAANLRANQREEASITASMGAAMTQWFPARAWDYYNTPKFDWEEGFNSASMLKTAGFPLDPEQEKFLIESKSSAEFQHKLDNLKDQRMAYEAMGDHGIASFLTGALDPGYLAIDVASLGAGRMAKLAGLSRAAQRIASGGTAMVGAYAAGKIEQRVAPMTETEVVLNALANGAATGYFHNGERLAKRDPTFPDQQLNRIVEDVKDARNEVVQSTAVREEEKSAFTKPREDQQATKVDVPTTPRVDSLEAGKLPPELAGAKPRYKTSTIEFESDIDKALYITAQNAKSKADEAYRGWLRREGFTDAQIEQFGKRVRDELKNATPEGDVITLPRIAHAVTEDAKVPVHTIASSRVGTEPGFRYASVSAKEMLYNLTKNADGMVSTLAKRIAELLKDEVEVRVTAKSNLYQRGRAYYDPATHAVYISAASTDGTKLHELTHAVTAHKLDYGLQNPNTVHGRITREIMETMAEAKSAYAKSNAPKGTAEDKLIKYYLSNIHEFVAGVYSGTSPFTTFLAKTAVKEGSMPILSKVVDSVRRLLGLDKKDTNALLKTIGLSEKLMENPLNTTLRNHSGEGSMSIRLQHPEDILTQADAKRALSKSLAHNISWSLHKTLSSFGETAKKVADLLVDDPLEMRGDSVVSQHRAIRADLSAAQYKYEDLLRDTLASQGFGIKNRILKPREAIAAQMQLERDVGMEMLRRNRLSIDGMPIDKTAVPKHIADMADALDNVSKIALDEMKRSGVKGAEDIAEHSGYFSRRWDISKIERLERKLVEGGLSEQDAAMRIRDMVAVGIQRANGWDAELASDVAKAIIDRTRRKGYFEDSAFRAHQGNDAAKEIRDLLTGTGIPEDRLQRVMDVLTGKADEKGKATHLKHRIDMAMDESIRLPDGSTSTIADMIDMNMAATTERYLDSVATQSAFARKGLPSTSDVSKLREEFLRSIESINKREEAAKLFDQTLNALRGLPTGEDMPSIMRKSQAVTQMVGLAASGMWQVTEYATAMMQYGMLKTVGSMFKELPGLRGLFADAKEATHLRNVLTRNASEDIRMRPFVQRMEDGFEIPVSDAAQLALMQAKQLVPYINAMKYIQHHQARTVGNLIVNTFERAVKGDAKAVKALEAYGLEGHRVVGIAGDISQHGMDTAKWSKSTWDTVRGPLTKMMDDAVLKSRTGEIPAFAQFSQLGKFIFTFRSFTLGAHNKILAGTMSRDGFAGLSLLMLYQFPLTAAVTSVNNTIQGKKPMDDKTLVATAMGQMGSLGLASELVGIASGTKQQFGAPGLIALDRMYKTAGAVATGQPGQAAAGLLNATPILSLIPGVKAIGEHLKD